MSLPPVPISQIEGARCLKRSLLSSEAFLSSDAVFVFLCGANKSNAHPEPVRDVLIEYARKHYTGFRFFRAEDVLRAPVGQEKTDWLTLEDRIADFSDCIIIVCESESAFAELGAFTLSEKLVKQVLVINDQKHRHSDSFINLGPIARADRKSDFKPAIYTDFQAVLKSIDQIEARLRLVHRTRRIRVSLRTTAEFKNAPSKIRILFLADLVHFFAPVTPGEIVALLCFVYGEGSYDITLELALLNSLRLIEHDSQWLRYAFKESAFFYDYERVRPSTLRAVVIRDYFRNDRDRLKHLPSKFV